jgi:hypothetical protein
MNKVFSSFDQHERQNNLEVIEDPRMILDATDGRFNGGPGGHTMETCYRKHGFAPGF